MDIDLQKAINAVTYNGAVKDMVINYALIVTVIVPHFIAGDNLKENNRSWYWVLCTSIILQVIVWYYANAAGVSIIWCALAGCNMLRFGRDLPYVTTAAKIVLITSVLFAMAGVIYYFIRLPFITTSAHIIAWSAGIILFYLYKKINNTTAYH